MKIFAIILINRSLKNTIIASEYDLSSFSFFQRTGIQEFMNFFAKTLADKTPQSGQRQVVEEQGYHGHVYTKDSTLSAILITDKEYPQRVVFGLLNKCTDEFTTAISRDKWSDKSFVNQYYGNQLKEYLSKYQNPHEADNIMKIQKELDDTKIILHKTMESVLERGERLDDLVAKSEELSGASKTFYKSAKATNSCCSLM